MLACTDTCDIYNNYVFLPTIAQICGNNLPPIFCQLSLWHVHIMAMTLVKADDGRFAGQFHWAPWAFFYSMKR